MQILISSRYMFRRGVCFRAQTITIDCGCVNLPERTGVEAITRTARNGPIFLLTLTGLDVYSSNFLLLPSNSASFD